MSAGCSVHEKAVGYTSKASVLLAAQQLATPTSRHTLQRCEVCRVWYLRLNDPCYRHQGKPTYETRDQAQRAGEGLIYRCLGCGRFVIRAYAAKVEPCSWHRGKTPWANEEEARHVIRAMERRGQGHGLRPRPCHSCTYWFVYNEKSRGEVKRMYRDLDRTEGIA
jgi:hypothetical protein